MMKSTHIKWPKVLRRCDVSVVLAIGVLSLGVGVLGAVFYLGTALVVRPLALPDASQVFNFWLTSERVPGLQAGFPRADAEIISSLAHPSLPSAFYRTRPMVWRLRDQSMQIETGESSCRLFEVLEVGAVVGHPYNCGHRDAETSGQVAVISSRLWKSTFAGSAAVIGSRIALKGAAYLILGVAGPDMYVPQTKIQPDIWIPVAPSSPVASADQYPFFVLARVQERTQASTLQNRANAALSSLTRGSADAWKWRIRAATLPEEAAAAERPTVFLLYLAAGIFLAIAAVNTSILLLGSSRKELFANAIRMALGASRGRLLRQDLAEVCGIALLVGCLGTALAWLLVYRVGFFWTAAPAPENTSSLIQTAAPFAFGIAGLVSVLCVLGPKLSALKGKPMFLVIGSGSRQAASWRRARGLLGIEAALSTVLLTVTFLLTHSLYNIQRIDIGLDLAGVTTFSVLLPQGRYPSDRAKTQFAEAVLSRLEKMRAVKAVAVSDMPILGSVEFSSKGVLVNGIPRPVIEFRTVSSGYFNALGIPIFRGKGFSAEDFRSGQRVAIVNRTMAASLGTVGGAVGKPLTLSAAASGDLRAFSIIGVVSDSRDNGLETAAIPEIYVPFTQWPTSSFSFFLTATRPLPHLANAIRSQVWAIDPDLPIGGLKLMRTIVQDQNSQPRDRAEAIGAIAIPGVLLTMIGIYGVFSLAVLQRTREIGMRMALGARPATIAALVIGDAFKMLALALPAGLAAALFASRALSHVLYGVVVYDPVSFLAAAGGVILITVAASYFPARRAAITDPMAALRCW